MAISMFDSTNTRAVSVFLGLKTVGYIIFSDIIDGRNFYKSIDSPINAVSTELLTDLKLIKKDIFIQTNKNRQEYFMVYTDLNNNIYSLTLMDSQFGGLEIKNKDTLVISNARHPVGIFDHLLEQYVIYYIDLADSKLHKSIFEPYDTLKSDTVIDGDIISDMETMFGSDLRNVILTFTQLTPNGYNNAYSLSLSNDNDLLRKVT